MSFINYMAREINCKIVYYGPGLCGKTTNLQYIYERTNPDAKGKMISLATETDRTLFFDFLPLALGEIRGDGHGHVGGCFPEGHLGRAEALVFEPGAQHGLGAVLIDDHADRALVVALGVLDARDAGDGLDGLHREAGALGLAEDAEAGG